MERRSLSIPEIAIIAGTRAMIGAGAALLLADHISTERRRALGWTLLAAGAVSTVPIAMQLFGRREAPSKPRMYSRAWRKDRDGPFARRRFRQPV